MKKVFSKPTIQTVDIQQQASLMAGSVNNIVGNSGIGYGGGGTGAARANENCDEWDDEDY